LALEGGALLVYRGVTGRWFHYRDGFDQLAETAKHGEAANPASAAGRGIVLHPYLGYVYSPESPETLPDHFHFDELGFRTAEAVVAPRSADRFHVAILGGSVAHWLSVFREGLLEELARAPELQGRRVVVSTLAIGAYKQPQQVLSLAYLMALGAHYDAVINLDGFNEVALPAPEETGDSRFPFYPTQWSLMTASLTDEQRLARVGEIVRVRVRRRETAAWLLQSWLRYSVTAELLWTVADRSWGREIYHHSARLGWDTGQGYLQNGPVNPYKDSLSLARASVEVWKNASLEIDHLARADGAIYLHVLQPNQYDLGSKPLSDEERRVALNPRLPFAKAVPLAYPMLRAAGSELKRRGVDFQDLSQIFRDQRSTFYFDECCHLNRDGNQVLGRVIGRLVGQRLAAKSQAREP
jgi:hypothetical protein